MKAKSKKLTDKFEYKQIKALLIKENQYIDELFRMLAIPPSAIKDEYEENIIKENTYERKVMPNGNSRAKSFEELQARFAELRGKKTQGYSDKLLKKNLKTRLKKKGKQIEKNNKQKLVRSQHMIGKTTEKVTGVKEKKIKPAKPVFNSEGKLVFSKFDFSNLGKRKEKKVEKDPKKILQNIKKDKEHIRELEGSGDKAKAQQIKEKQAWQNALAKAEGKKVKDDTELLQKSMKKQQQLKNKSKKKWEARVEGVNKAGEERQKKRTENIEKRKKDKKTKSLKKAVKKGKIIPGF